jgi:hypothetical protein
MLSEVMAMLYRSEVVYDLVQVGKVRFSIALAPTTDPNPETSRAQHFYPSDFSPSSAVYHTVNLCYIEYSQSYS